MAVDKKSQHVGNHGGTYTDMDGMTKQFTYVDHDKKTSIPTQDSKPENGWQTKYRALLTQRISDLPASLCPEPFVDYTVRGEGKAVITWNMDMLLDSGNSTNRLRDLCILLENKAELIKLI